MRNKILILGYFGYENNQLDGQTIKTRSIYELFSLKQEQENFDLKNFDTQSFQKNKLNVFRMFSAIIKSNTLIYIAAHNNLKYLFLIIYLICRLFNIKMHYIVVGGWLAEFIKTKPLHIRFLRNIEGIYPETKDLYCRLIHECNFQNVYQLQNFRISQNNNIDISIRGTVRNNIKLVFMARVHPMKGVDTLFSLAEELERKTYKNVTIDIYGPIQNEYKEQFEEDLSKYEVIQYKGVLLPNEIYNALKEYDLMLFPTQYFTEGFPGSILDAYISGIPVIATRWKYADEFIENNKCGVIIEFGNTDEFIKETLCLIENPEEIDRLKSGTRNQVKKYSSDTAWTILKNKIFT